MTTKKQDTEELVQSHEFRITKMQPGTEIEANFPEIEAKIAEITELYAGTIVSLDYLPQARKDRAYLNGLVKSVEQRRIEAKNAYMQPYNAFEAQVKALLAPVREASANLDAQIKALDEQERANKRQRLAAYYEGMAGALLEAVPFERIEDPAWLNKTCHLEDAYKAIDAIIERIFRDDQTLDGLALSHPREAKAEFFATLDLSRAIARSKALDEQEEAARRIEEAKAANLAALQAQAEPEPEPEPAPVVPKTSHGDDPEVRWIIEVTCTRSAINAIMAYMQSIHLTGKVVRR